MTSVAQQPWAALERRAIGTYVHVLVTDPSTLPAADALVVADLDALDRACSRFRDDSELVRLAGATGPVAVSTVLAGALAAALAVAADTDGLVQPTLGRALRSVGYDRTFSTLPEDGPAAVRLPLRPDLWRDIVVDGCEVTLPAGADLDLGATAKAWAADGLADRIAALGTGVLVNLGGDIAVVGPAPEGGWPVAVTDRPGGAVLQTVALASGGLATSSTTARTWRRGGQVMHHILDPATGLPVPPVWECVTVCAPTCLAANAASTAAVVLGAEAPAWLEAAGLPALLRARTGEGVRVNGWPEDGALR
ncbi:MAG: FAD:protein FMN transferase [Mycobacteriales bacterium]